MLQLVWIGPVRIYLRSYRDLTIFDILGDLLVFMQLCFHAKYAGAAFSIIVETLFLNFN